LKHYHKPASAGNSLGLPEINGLPALDWDEPTNANQVTSFFPSGLTVGGRLIYRRTHSSVSICNLMANLAGIGPEVRHG
jgi:hypothetical protein